jgi:hypothetical protein
MTGGTATLSGGVATFTTTAANTNFAAAGTKSITAVYNGSASYSGSTSPALSQVVSAGTGPTTISPTQAALTLQQTQQFTTNAAGGAVVNWSVNGIAGGSSTVGTISSSGLYTPPSSPGTYTVTAVNSGNSSLSVSAPVAVTNLTGIFTYHNDAARTGQNLQEYALTPATVSSGNFGKRWSCTVDGLVSAQPLYVANVSIGGGVHNVLIVADMHDSVYAFDADNGSCTPYWHRTFLSSGVTTISSSDATCNDVLLEYGVDGTPVIDPSTQTIYLVAATTEDSGTTYVQRLHALSLATGADISTPVEIMASVSGTGDDGITVTFNALYSNQHLGLALTSDGGIIIGWSSHCDNTSWPWHGWIMRYDESNLTRSAVFNDTPNGQYGGIWMSGGAPALDSEGNMFMSTGNGTFDDTSDTIPAPNNDFGESFINLNLDTLAVQDFYTPANYATWSSEDLDLSSSGVTVLPDGIGPSAHPNLLVGSDKQGHLWMIDRSSMSGYVKGANDTVQYLNLPNGTTCNSVDQQCVYATPAYWNGNVYVSIEEGPVMAFELAGGLVPASSGTAVASSQTTQTYSYPNPTPVISASPSGNAIVWVLDNNANGTDNGSAAPGAAILRAYEATNLATLLYSSSTLSSDAAGNASKFVSPVVANGHVYVVGAGSFTVYALAP